jgi:hypothetical protein
LLYASSTSALSRLADVATGNALISGGVGVAPSYGKVGLTTTVTGILPVANGGTNSATALNNNRIMVSSAGAIVEAAAMANGQLLIGSTGAAPVVAALTQGSGITITNGAGSISIATNATLTPQVICISSTYFSIGYNAATVIAYFPWRNARMSSYTTTRQLVAWVTPSTLYTLTITVYTNSTAGTNLGSTVVAAGAATAAITTVAITAPGADCALAIAVTKSSATGGNNPLIQGMNIELA